MSRIIFYQKNIRMMELGAKRRGVMNELEKIWSPHLPLSPPWLGVHALLAHSQLADLESDRYWTHLHSFTTDHVPRTSRYAISMALDLVTHSITVQYMFIIKYLIFNYVTLYLHFWRRVPIRRCQCLFATSSSVGIVSTSLTVVPLPEHSRTSRAISFCMLATFYSCSPLCPPLPAWVATPERALHFHLDLHGTSGCNLALICQCCCLFLHVCVLVLYRPVPSFLLYYSLLAHD